MGKLIDLTGQRFGRLVVLGIDSKYIAPCGKRDAKWRCQCDCGKETTVIGRNLLSGRTRSCGCLHRELLSERDTVHGERFTRLYRIWSGMKSRCYIPSSTSYPWYGARGIAVCAEWKNSFVSFKNWAMSHGYQDDLTIDRINVDGNYEPDNCRWVTAEEQQHNKRVRK